MSASVEASNLMKEIAGPVPVGTRVEEVIRRVARKLRWSESRAKDIYYRAARRIDAEEMDALRSAARVKQEGGARVEYVELIEHLEAIRSRLDALEKSLGRSSA
jgi:hypothetical protein